MLKDDDQLNNVESMAGRVYADVALPKMPKSYWLSLPYTPI